jgi:hypothetical protein
LSKHANAANQHALRKSPSLGALDISILGQATRWRGALAARRKTNDDWFFETFRIPA